MYRIDSFINKFEILMEFSIIFKKNLSNCNKNIKSDAIKRFFFPRCFIYPAGQDKEKVLIQVTMIKLSGGHCSKEIPSWCIRLCGPSKLDPPSSNLRTRRPPPLLYMTLDQICINIESPQTNTISRSTSIESK